MRPLPRRAHPSGFTMIEMLTVIAIIGVVSAMAAATAQNIGARNAVQNAASDLGSWIQSARARADQRGSDVYVLVYPEFRRAPSRALTGGRGLIVIFEDSNGDFLTSTGLCTGSAAPTAQCGWQNFDPTDTNKMKVGTGTTDRVLEVFYLEDYAGKNVKFGQTALTGTWPMPFNAIDEASGMTDGCSFCTSGKGAMRFTADQQVQFIDGTGNPTADHVGGISLVPVNGTASNGLRYGVVSATALISLVK